METIFTNTENSKTNEPHRFKLTLADKLNLKDPNKNMALTNLSIYYTEKNNNVYIMTINLKYLLQLGMMNLIFPDGSYSISDIQDYFEYIIKKNETIANNPPVQIYVNKIKIGVFLN